MILYAVFMGKYLYELSDVYETPRVHNLDKIL